MDVYVYKLVKSGLDTAIYGNLHAKACNYFVDKISQTDSYIVKCNKLITDCLLRHVFSVKYGLTLGKDDIICNLYNKPHTFEDNLFFNLSHSSIYGALVVSKQPVGIDIEDDFKIINTNISKSILNPLEVYQYEKTKNKSKYLTSLWTVKESYLKGLGFGLSIQMNKICYIKESKSVRNVTDESKSWYVNQRVTDKFVLSTSCTVDDEVSYHYIKNIYGYIN